MPYPRFRISLPLEELALSLIQALFAGRPTGATECFQREFLAWGNFPAAVLVASGRAGFRLLLESLGEGGEIIFPAYTFHPIPVAAAEAGWTPVFADVEPGSWNLDPEQIRPLINRHTRAIMPTHLFGVPAEMDQINALASEYGLAVIEDCAHALGARYHGRPAGTLGDGALFTFAMSKNLPCWGGGAMVVRDPDLAQRMNSALAQTRPPGGGTILRGQLFSIVSLLLTHPAIFPWTLYPFLRGAGSRLGQLFDRPFLEDVVAPLPPLVGAGGRGAVRGIAPFQAAVGSRQLKRFHQWLERQEKNARLLRSLLAGCPGLRLQEEPPGSRSSFLYLRAWVEDPPRTRRELLRVGVDTKPDDMRDCSGLGIFSPGPPCPQAAQLAGRCLELPCSPFYSDAQIEDIADRVRRACSS